MIDDAISQHLDDLTTFTNAAMDGQKSSASSISSATST